MQKSEIKRLNEQIKVYKRQIRELKEDKEALIRRLVNVKNNKREPTLP